MALQVIAATSFTRIALFKTIVGSLCLWHFYKLCSIKSLCYIKLLEGISGMKIYMTALTSDPEPHMKLLYEVNVLTLYVYII